jgi:proteasome lid subunit RPN8/RPN11
MIWHQGVFIMLSYTIKQMVISSEPASSQTDAPIIMAARLCLRFLQQARAIHTHGLKSYGVFTAEAGGSPFLPADVWFIDPKQNRRNNPQHRPSFEAQGTYFRAHHDAGFVVDSGELASVERAVGQAGQMIVAPFHSHRRQPPNFSDIDYRLHNPFFSWHLIVCLRNLARPEIQPFRVDKGLDDFGIDPNDAREGSERAYQGDNVRPLDLVVEGTDAELDEVAMVLGLS